jgi:siroheme synthase
MVVLMAAGALSDTCRALIDGGRGPDAPAAVIHWATTSEQRSVFAPLDELGDVARAAAIGPPATLVVGDVASVALELAYGRTMALETDAATETSSPVRSPEESTTTTGVTSP